MAAVGWLHRTGLAAAPRDPAAAVSLLGARPSWPRRDAATRDVIRTDLSVALGWAGHTDDGERLAAAVMAETLDVDVRARAASWLTSSLLLRGRPQEAHDLCRRALASGVGSARVEILLRMVAEIASVALGDRPARWTGCGNCWPPRPSSATRRSGPPALQGLSLAEANAGDLDAAAAYGAAAVRDTESVHTAEAFMANTHVLYAWILEEQDRLAEALETVGRLRHAGRGERRVPGRGSDRPLAGQGALRRRALGRGRGRPGLGAAGLRRRRWTCGPSRWPCGP